MTQETGSPDGFGALSSLVDVDERADDLLEPAPRRSGGRIALIIAGALALAVLLATGGYTIWALTTPVPPPAVSWASPPVATPDPAALALPADGATAVSVAGADAYLGSEAAGIWATSGSTDPQPIASISKIITALVIVDAYPLADASDPGPTITFSKADHDLYDQYYVQGATIAPMPTGSTMSLHDALATMLIPSASNYAEALSTWAFGSPSGFRTAVRDWLAAHGLTGTTIVEPTGLNPKNVSTTSDLLAIGRLAAQDPTIAAIAATPSVSLSGPGTLINTNDLLGSEGITGLKTGNLGYGTYGLLYTANLDVGLAAPLAVTGVVVSSPTRGTADDAVLALLRSIRAGFHDVPLISAGDQLGQFTTPWGSSGRIVAASDAAVLTWSDTPIEVSVDLLPDLQYQDGQAAGTVTWTAGPETVTVDLIMEGTLRPPTEWWRLTHPGELAGNG